MQNKTQTNNKTTNGDDKMEKMIEIVEEIVKRFKYVGILDVVDEDNGISITLSNEYEEKNNDFIFDIHLIDAQINNNIPLNIKYNINKIDDDTYKINMEENNMVEVYKIAKSIYQNTDEPSNIGDNYKDIFIEYAQEFYPEENEYALWSICVEKIIPQYATDEDIKEVCKNTLNSVLLTINNEMIRIEEKSSHMEEDFESRNIWNDEIESFISEFLNKCKLEEPYSNESIGYVQGVIYSYLIDYFRGE